jgi:PIN domain nuclease of toxin-antitoxin system
MLAAQSREERAALVTCDAAFRDLGVTIIWD